MGVTSAKGEVYTFLANADLSTAQYKLMKMTSTADTVDLSTAVSDIIVGVLLNAPAAANRAASVQVSGICEVLAGGTVTVGAKLKSHTTDGTVTDSSADADVIVGIALTSGSAGQRVKMLLTLAAMRAA